MAATLANMEFILDELCAIAVCRYTKEMPTLVLSKDFISKLRYSIWGVLIAEGETSARRYVETAKLRKSKLGMMHWAGDMYYPNGVPTENIESLRDSLNELEA